MGGGDETVKQAGEAGRNQREADDVEAAGRCCLVAWEDRDQGTVCETVYRVKGLDVDRVLLVADESKDDDELLALLYAGASRALESLTIIGPDGVLRRV